MKIKKLSPILLFVYNRLLHTTKNIDALKNNKFVSDSDLIIYSDYAKDEESVESVKKVRQYLKSINGFKSVSIVERKKNWGLADSIIDGVTEVVNQYGKVIVIEDDLITSPYFLKYMNEALDYYKAKKRVWHVSGWTYPIESEQLNDTFLWRLMNCSGGWATWADRWQYYEKNIDKTIEEFSKKDIVQLNLGGIGNFWDQVLSNKRGKINTWAIFWYATIFKENGLCLNPSISFVKNIGFDGSGVHCSGNDSDNIIRLNQNSNIKFESNLSENKYAVGLVTDYFKQQRKSIFSKVMNKISSVIIRRKFNQ